MPRNSATAAAPCGPRLPTLSINDVSVAEGNAGTTAFAFTVSLSAPAGAGGVSFDIATADGTGIVRQRLRSVVAHRADDCSGQHELHVHGAGQRRRNVRAQRNLLRQCDHRDRRHDRRRLGLGTIVNDDGGAMLSIDDVSQNEGNSGTTTFTLYREPVRAGAGRRASASTSRRRTARRRQAATTSPNRSPRRPSPLAPTTYTFSVDVNGDTSFEPNETFFVNVTNVTGAFIADGQGLGTIVNDDVSGPRIHDVQGDGQREPDGWPDGHAAGIVTANFQAANSLGGFYLQEEDANIDADPATSEGIFIFHSATTVAVGDKVNVTGTVAPSSAPHPIRHRNHHGHRADCLVGQSAAGAG